MIDDLDEIKERIVLSDLFREYGCELRRSGSSGNWVCLCPFHGEKTPSMVIHDDEYFFKCFGCGIGGDAIKFIAQIEKKSFSDALSIAKSHAGIEDVYVTPDQRVLLDRDRERRKKERAAFSRWKSEILDNLILYTNCQWEIYRIAARQLMRLESEELLLQADMAHDEAIRKEMALDQLESMADSDLMPWFRTRSQWEGVMNPPWFLSHKKLVKAQEVKDEYRRSAGA